MPFSRALAAAADLTIAMEEYKPSDFMTSYDKVKDNIGGQCTSKMAGVLMTLTLCE